MQDNIIYCTSDYTVFKKLCGNRVVLEQRKNTIKNSIIENGYVRNPIVVNEKMEIIDGQGRFEALKELKLPVEYVIAHGAGQKECIALNANQKNWKSADYVKSFAELGIEEYQTLQTLCEMFPSLDQMNIVNVVAKIGNGGSSARIIREGRFKIYHKETVVERLKYYEKLHGVLNGLEFGIQRTYAGIVSFLYECEEIDHEKLFDNLCKYIKFVTPSFTTKQAIEMFEFIYNRCAKKYVYFRPLYDEWVKIK